MMQPSRFPFLDEGEALRRLNLDRDTLLGLVREGRLRAYAGFGKGNFFRIRDLDALYAEIYGESSAGDLPAEATPGKGKPFDPAYKVHVRLQADLKWYDLSDDDLRAWVREMHEDGYPRQRTNITNTIARLQRLIDLMDEAAAGWRVLQPAAPRSAAAKPTRGRSLPMATLATPSSPAPSDTPATDASAAPPSRRGRPLQMLGGTPTPAPAAPDPAPPPTTPTRGRPLQMLNTPGTPTPQAPPPSPPATAAPKPSRRGKPLPLAGSPPPPDLSREGQ